MGQLGKLLAVALAVVLVSGVSTAAFYAWNATEALADSGVDIADGDTKQLPPSIGEIEGGVNMLVVGTDSCEGQSTKLFPRCKHDPGGERNDVTMLVHIGDKPRRVTVVSFPRDMLVPIPSCPDGKGGRYSAMSSQPLNASYMYGGLPCTVLTIKALTGLNIQFAASIRWTGVINMSDAIGGVDVCVAGRIDDRHTGLHLTKGTHTLKGKKALQFLRTRYGVGDGSDTSRISNQQVFMSAMLRQLKSADTLGNPVKVYSLAKAGIENIRLSKNMANIGFMQGLAGAVKDIDLKRVNFVQYPTGRHPYQSGRLTPNYELATTLFDLVESGKSFTVTSKGMAAVEEGKKGEETGTDPKDETGTGSSDEKETGSSTDKTNTDKTKKKAKKTTELPEGIPGQSADDQTCSAGRTVF